MNGLWRCAEYAFSPNYLKYCGPDKNQELAGYLKTKTTDDGLKSILDDFEAMYPYLKLIARENGIADPFNEKVVEAYWLGNALLDRVRMKGFFNHVNKKLTVRDLKWFEWKLPQGAKPNHQFHVFNFINRTGHQAIPHTVETMDSCRISWGEIIDSNQFGNTKFPGAPARGGQAHHLTESDETLRAQKSVFACTDKLIYKNGQLDFEPAVKEVQSFDNDLKPGDLVTIHWNWVCEKINRQQAENLEKYTDFALKLANLTI